MRARSTTIDLPALSPPPLVLKRARRWRVLRTVVLELVLLVLVGFFFFALTHRFRAHSAGNVECCATAKAR